MAHESGRRHSDSKGLRDREVRHGGRIPSYTLHSRKGRSSGMSQSVDARGALEPLEARFSSSVSSIFCQRNSE